MKMRVRSADEDAPEDSPAMVSTLGCLLVLPVGTLVSSQQNGVPSSGKTYLEPVVAQRPQREMSGSCLVLLLIPDHKIRPCQ